MVLESFDTEIYRREGLVHHDLTGPVNERRHAALTAARAANPERFTSTSTPKILTLPEAAWINPPVPEPETQDPQPQETAA